MWLIKGWVWLNLIYKNACEFEIYLFILIWLYSNLGMAQISS